ETLDFRAQGGRRRCDQESPPGRLHNHDGIRSSRYTGIVLPSRLFRALALAGSLAAYTADITPARKAALDQISGQSLRGHISFLASDLLEGRDTPSPGLNTAA